MRVRALALMAAVAAMFCASGREGLAEPASSSIRLAQAAPPEAPALRRRPPTRLRVYPTYREDEVFPRYNPGPGAVRECNATYVQEYRPSGPVIVPHMSCYWRRG